MRTAFLAFALTAWALPVCAQVPAPADPEFRIEFEHPGTSPAHWTLIIHPDGSGHFHSLPGEPPQLHGMENQRILDLPEIDRDIHLSARYARRVFDVARRHKYFNEECENRQKVAFSGWKRLSYQGQDGSGSCRFNSGRDKEINALSDSLLSVEETILYGERMKLLLQYDRLGLDTEMEGLWAAVEESRAEQIGSIREVLDRLCDDPRVLERVKKRARMLLARIGEE
jgi:hypothetical protein